jgi:hypothetical protein
MGSEPANSRYESSRRLRAPRVTVQVLVAAFGVVMPLFLAAKLVSSHQWAWAALWFMVFLAVEATAIWLVPMLMGAWRPK